MFVMLLYFINLLFILPVTLCDERIPCDFEDEACLTAAYKILFKDVVSENSKFQTKSSDTLYKDKIEAILPRMNLTLNNAYMHGTKSCDVENLRIKTEEWFATYICPKMTLTSNYDINGDVDCVHIEGKGRCQIIYDNYRFGVRGIYDTYKGKNDKDHLKISYYKIDFIDVQGSAIYNFTNMSNGNNEEAERVHEYINRNWRKFNDIIGEPVIYSLFNHFIDNVNNYLSVVPKYEIFYKS